MKKLTLVLAILIAAASLANIQAQEYSYFRFSATDGFPSKVNTVFVEKDGYAWIGANDGLYILISNNSYIHYTKENAAESHKILPGNNILKIFGDSHNVIWVMTDGGFVGYKTELHFDKTENIIGLDGNTVVYCACEVGNAVYFGGENRIWKYDYNTEAFSAVLSINATPSFKIKDLLHGASNGGNDLLVFKYGGGHFIYDTINKFPRESAFQNDNGYYNSYLDSQGNLWQPIYNDGYYCISPDGVVLCHVTTEQGLSSNSVLCFQEVGDEMWIGTDGGGINIFNFKTMGVRKLEHNQHFRGSLPTSTVSSMFADHNGHIWCCSPSQGVFVVSKSNVKNYGSELMTWAPSFEGFSTLYQDGPNDKIWIGTNGAGVYSFDPQTEHFEAMQSTAGMNIYSLSRYSDNKLAFTSINKGGYILDKNTGKLEKVTADDDNEVFHSNWKNEGAVVDTDEQGRVMTFAEKIIRSTPEKGLNEFFDLSSFTESSIIQPVQGSHCKYLEDSRRIFKWNENSVNKLEVIYELDGPGSLRGGSMDGNGCIWFPTEDGFATFNTFTNTMSFNPKKFSSSPSIVMCDNKDRIWFATDNEIFAYSPDDGRVMTLSEIDGIRRETFSQFAKLIASDGNLYIAGQRSLLRIDTNISAESEPDPDIIVQRMTVDGKVIDKESYKIPTNHRSVDAQFFVKSNDILSTRMYRFHIEGAFGQIADEETTVPAVHFRRVSPGWHYVTVSCTKSDGSWSEPKEVLSFFVRKPYYATPWFIILSVILLFAFVYLLRRSIYARREEAKEMENERYNFMVDVNHELRTPLTLVTGHLNRMKKDPDLDEKTHGTVDKILLQTRKMSSLLNTVLTTSKIKEGNTKINITSVDFNDWLREIASEFYDEAKSHDMKLVLRLDPTIGMVPMDENLMEIVCYNLITNAIKHNLSGHHITIWSGWDKNNPSMIRVGVKDHGSGIGTINPDKVFDGFYKVTEESTGFGLGLAYSKTLVEAHKGKIGAYNNADDPGATFWFEIPAGTNTLRSEEKIREAVRNRSRKIEDKVLHDKVILFVDDDADLRIFMYDELKRFCSKVILASGADEALHLLHDNEVDAVITDVVMPDKDGFDLCREIKSTPQYLHIPVILLTAMDDDINRSKGFSCKADYFLPKPFEIESLLAILDFKFNPVKKKEEGETEQN